MGEIDAVGDCRLLLFRCSSAQRPIKLSAAILTTAPCRLLVVFKISASDHKPDNFMRVKPHARKSTGGRKPHWVPHPRTPQMRKGDPPTPASTPSTPQSSTSSPSSSSSSSSFYTASSSLREAGRPIQMQRERCSQAARKSLFGRRPSYRHSPGSLALREIRKYQKSTDTLIPKATFSRLTRQLTLEIKPGHRWTKTAVDALQQAAEAFVVGVLEEANLAAGGSELVA
ncbi:core histone h2a/h2b/h3/h4 superfamily protein [Acanthamoeba castellanii str. Neff]|uniref:Core histone h2a/h2b/h3/h4 superfamily protein n=1 Tax=Acanthamoeba castellanii (strain ATCC 30010 / Neff) TaxID=1257118 RepID=L8HJV2_ACACF|nr:core histone h2a/h2b/h3/h4 superfamily protein [Acanthamoeba castellanii str. Neff]ELR25487.1 core histone h2a/h2b/h3/h4 superfamily protein [Acanthamoeba castellanii str. Neff]